MTTHQLLQILRRTPDPLALRALNALGGVWALKERPVEEWARVCKSVAPEVRALVLRLADENV